MIYEDSKNFYDEVIDCDGFELFIKGFVENRKKLFKYAKSLDFESIIKKVGGQYFIKLVHHKSGVNYYFCDILGLGTVYLDKEKSEFFIMDGLPKFKVSSKKAQRVIKFGYLLNGKTVFKNVDRVYPGKIYFRDTKSSHIMKFKVPIGLKISFKNINFKELMQDKIDTYLQSKSGQKINVLISGGLDSSIVYYHIKNSKYFDDVKISTFCMNYPDEVEHAKLMDPNVKVLEPVENKEQAIQAQKSPIDLGSMLSQNYIFDLLKNSNIVTGDGPDEIFGGYRRYLTYDAQITDVFDELVNYHIPRVVEMSRTYKTDVFCPFLSLDVLKYGFNLYHKQRVNKVHLRSLYEDVLPEGIIKRVKKPLKSMNILTENPEQNRNENINILKGLLSEKYK